MHRHMYKPAARWLVVACLAMTAMLLATWPGQSFAAPPAVVPGPVNVDVSRRHLNESEESIAVNPTNPNNIVIVTNVGHREAGLTAGMLKAVSFDGGNTWTTSLIGNHDNLGDACCDPSLSFDEYGNLFMTYLNQIVDQDPIA